MKTIDEIILLGREENIPSEPWEIKMFVGLAVVVLVGVLIYLV